MNMLTSVNNVSHFKNNTTDRLKTINGIQFRRFKTSFPLWITFLFCLSISVFGSEKSDSPPVNSQGTIDTIQNVLDEIFVYLSDVPSGYLQQSFEEYLNFDIKNAAVSLKKASAFLKLERMNAKRTDKSKLRSAIKELTGLSRQIEKGTGPQVKDIKKVYARAEFALSSVYFSRSKSSYTDKKYVNAGYSLQAATKHIRNAWHWAKGSMPTGDAAYIVDTFKKVEDLKQNKNIDKVNTSEIFTNIERILATLEKNIPSPPDKKSKKG